MSEIEFDLDIIIAYVKNNWTSTVTPPDDGGIFRDGGSISTSGLGRKRFWQFVNAIKLDEIDTKYSLLDMYGSADRTNDTEINVHIYSKSSESVAEEMTREFIAQIRALAHTNEIGVWAFTQITASKPYRHVYYTKQDVSILLTRRGKGHTD